MIDAEYVRSVLDYNPDVGTFTWKSRVSRNRNAGSEAGCIDAYGYRCICIKGKTFKAHRLAWLVVHGEWPKQQIDHINGDRRDNSFNNLRSVEKSINMQNQRKAHSKNLLGTLGVSELPSGRFQAAISHLGKRKALGVFDTKEQAHDSYLHAKRELHPGCTL